MGRRSRLRRVLRALLAAALVLVVVGAGSVAVLWPLTPSVAATPQLVAARARAHGDPVLSALPVPDRAGQAVIATEDSRFYSHHGLDIISVLRAGWGFVTRNGDTGAATLDQQLMKNLYTPHRHGVAAKLEQVELSFKLESRFSKHQILRMYLAAVYFGNGFYGLPAASRGYFGVAPSRLSWGQAALLAGLVQAPSRYDPFRAEPLARARERHVLDRLVVTGVLTRAAAQAAYAAPLHLLRLTPPAG